MEEEGWKAGLNSKAGDLPLPTESSRGTCWLYITYTWLPSHRELAEGDDGPAIPSGLL